jgi:ATP-dependent Clp protease protease subunit
VRCIAVEGWLDDDQALRVVTEIRAAAGRPVDLRIDSQGGKFGAAIDILLEVEEHDAWVATTVIGEACSAAGLIAIAGDVRRIDPRGTIMLHYPRPASRDGALKAREIAQEYTRQPMDEIISWHARERTFSAAEAVQHGLADRIVDVTAPEPVRLWDPPKRRPAEWLKEYRDLYERLDLRVDAQAAR